jgi:hypothetical protein
MGAVNQPKNQLIQNFPRYVTDRLERFRRRFIARLRAFQGT